MWYVKEQIRDLYIKICGRRKRARQESPVTSFFDANLTFGGYAIINSHQQLCQAMIDHCCTALSSRYEGNMTHVTTPIRKVIADEDSK